MKRGLIYTAVVGVSTILSLPNTSFAQAEKVGRQLEEVRVTAQRTSQSVQDVPISISVVSQEDLVANSIFDFAETVQLTPGVEVNNSNPALAAIRMRGIGPSFLSAGGSQSVTVFVDQVAQSQVGAVFSTMVDVERIEVLKGPQGTLYGRNAPSGAYNITTVAPSFDETSGYINGTVGIFDANNEETIDLRGAFNIPLVDNRVALRVAAVRADSDGGIEMASPIADAGATGGKDHKSVRARLLWTIDERSELDVIGNYKKLTDYYAANQWEGLVPGTGGANPFPAQFNSFGNQRDFSNSRSVSDTEINDLSLHYRFAGEAVNIDAIFGYGDFDTVTIQYPENFPTLTPGRFDFIIDTKQTTYELRASNSNDVFDYVAGLYAIRREGGSDSFFDLGALQIPTDSFLKGGGEAVFGNVTFHLHEQWDATAGLRYEEYEFNTESDTTVSGFGGVIDDDIDFQHTSWSGKLKYYPSQDMTAYLAIDNSYRQGGFNTYMPAIRTIGEVLAIDGLIAVADLYAKTEKEESMSFELGLKGTALDGTLRYNLAIFYQEFENHILVLPLPNLPALDLIGSLFGLSRGNAEEVVTQGVEFDATWAVDDNWTVDFRAAYFDAFIEQWENKPCSVQFNDPVGEAFCPAESGDLLTPSPKWTSNTQLSYAAAVADGWLLSGNLAWNWKSKSPGDGFTDRYNDPINIFNLTVGLSNEVYSVRLWGKNLTDEDENQYPYFTDNGDPTQPAAQTGVFTPGREYGVTLGYNF